MIITVFSVLMLAANPSATKLAASPAPAATASAPKVERKICRRDAASESRLRSKRICLTPAEWKARDAAIGN